MLAAIKANQLDVVIWFLAHSGDPTAYDRKKALSCSAELTASRQRLSLTASARALRNSPPSLTMATFKNIALSIHFPPSRKYSCRLFSPLQTLQLFFYWLHSLPLQQRDSGCARTCQGLVQQE